MQSVALLNELETMEFPLNVAIAGVITMIFFTRELRFTLPDIEVFHEISNLKTVHTVCGKSVY